MHETPLLSVRDLTIAARTMRGDEAIVRGVSFDVGAERVALVGESGSGKSLTARAVMGLLPRTLSMQAERFAFDGRDLRALAPEGWRSLRGRQIALVMQDPRQALNPVMTVEAQIGEAIDIHHRGLPRTERSERTAAILRDVGLEPSARVLRALAHQLSGGMAQRVMLAVMLVNGPRLLIADEPTSALDHALRDQVLELISTQVERRRMGLLLISHDLQQVQRFGDRVLVMRSGQLVESLAARDLANATHPYTRTLWSCRPSAQTYRTRLPVLDRSSDTWSEIA